jgi:hypothetical protein
MPAFQYAPFDASAYVTSIGSLLAHQGDPAAQAAVNIANANARAKAASGDIWGRTIQQVGQLPAQVMAQRQDSADRAQERALRRQQIETGAQALEEHKATLAEQNKQRIVTTVGTLAKGASSAEEFVSRMHDLSALGGMPQDVADHIAETVTKSGDWSAIQKQYVDFAGQYAKPMEIPAGGKVINPTTGAVLADNPRVAAPVSVAPGHALVDPVTYQPVFTAPAAPPNTEAALAADAANPSSPTAAQSVAALQALRTPRNPPSLQEQLLEAVTKGDSAAVDRIKTTLKTEADARRDPAASALANELAGLRKEEAAQRLEALKKKNAPIDVSADIQTTRLGGKYIDLSTYQGDERNKARDAASAAGAIAVSKEQANALQEIDNARANQQSILDQISDLLPKNPATRTAALVGTPIERLLQTDDRIAAFSSWRTAAINTLRATAGSKGLRINKSEIEQAVENDIPKLTDTLTVAQRKVKNIQTMLDNAEKSILTRDRSADAPTPLASAKKKLGMP